MDLPHRRSIRLEDFDYSSNGAYFVTICTQNREMLFGDIVNEKMVLNQVGEIIDRHILSLIDRYSIQIPIYQIMPNHVHLVIVIVGAHHDAPVIWQRNYFEHVIRNEENLEKIFQYIESNPRMWDKDKENLVR